MYDLESLRRKINKEGVPHVIEDLCSTNFSEHVMNQLETAGIFNKGVLNLSLIYSLANY